MCIDSHLPTSSHPPSPTNLGSIYTRHGCRSSSTDFPVSGPRNEKVMEAGWFPLRLGGFHGNTTTILQPRMGLRDTTGPRGPWLQGLVQLGAEANAQEAVSGAQGSYPGNQAILETRRSREGE